MKKLRPFAGIWEGLASFSLFLIVLLWFSLIVGFNSTTTNATTGWWIFSVFLIVDISVRAQLTLADVTFVCSHPSREDMYFMC